MVFNSFIFLIFLAIVLIAYYRLPRRYRNLFLLLCNYLFYIYFDVRFASLLLAITVIDYFLAEKIQAFSSYKGKKRILIIGLITNLLALGIFKYFNFFMDSFVSMISIFGFHLSYKALELILPLGISFYIFQSLTYLFAIYLEQIEEKYTLLEFAVFVSFFPTISAGPIERASNLLPQIRQPRSFSSSHIREGFILITAGMFRKVIIGDTAGKIVDHVFAQPQYFASLEIIMGILLFAVQIYNDFAGYSSIAKGVAKLLGFEIMDNFRQPYLSRSILEFWRRWHISLSNWLKDYVFKPLQFKFRDYDHWGNIISLLLTFTLCGLWHGARWTFIIWGFLHGFYMSFSLLTANLRRTIRQKLVRSESLKKYSQISITFFLVTFSWIFFKAESFGNASVIFERLFHWTSSELTLRIVIIMASYSLASIFIDFIEIKFQSQAFLLCFSKPVRTAIILTCWTTIFLYLFTYEKSPFLYTRF